MELIIVTSRQNEFEEWRNGNGYGCSPGNITTINCDDGKFLCLFFSINIRVSDNQYDKLWVIEPCNRDVTLASQRLICLIKNRNISPSNITVLFHTGINLSNADSLREECNKKGVEVNDVRPYTLGSSLQQFPDEVVEYIRKIQKFLRTLNPCK